MATQPTKGSETVTTATQPTKGSETVTTATQPTKGSETVTTATQPTKVSETVITATQPTKGSETVMEMTVSDDPELVSRETQAKSIIQRNMVWALGLGAVPYPLVDLVGITAVQLKMLKELSNLYGLKFSESIASKILTSLIAGFGSVSLGAALAGSFLKAIPGIGTLLGIAAVPVTASALTYATGKVFLMHFESGGTLFDFDPEAMRAHFRAEVELGKAAAKALKDRQHQPHKAGAP